jgi:hypothetical protein
MLNGRLFSFLQNTTQTQRKQTHRLFLPFISFQFRLIVTHFTSSMILLRFLLFVFRHSFSKKKYIQVGSYYMSLYCQRVKAIIFSGEQKSYPIIVNLFPLLNYFNFDPLRLICFDKTFFLCALLIRE